jgi:hypothetical protein
VVLGKLSPKTEGCIFKSILHSFMVFFSLTESSRKFKIFAREQVSPKVKTNKLILVENRNWALDILSLLHFLPFASEFYNANVLVYEMETSNIFKNTLRRIKHQYSILNSISKSNFWNVTASPKHQLRHEKILNSLSAMTKTQFLSFEYRGTLIGDLIYDQILRKKNRQTINMHSEDIVFFTSRALQFCDKFLEYFQNNPVGAVIVSHPTYLYAIPARVAMKFKIDVFTIDHNMLVKVNEDNPNCHLNIRRAILEETKTLTTEIRHIGRLEAKERIADRLKGSVKDFGLYSLEGEVPTQATNQNLLTSNKPFVLVALHDFHDAPHVYGLNFHPDFGEWLEDLGKCTVKSNFTFLIKSHPFARASTKDYLQELCSRYPQFILVQPEMNNEDLVKTFKIKYCLTVYGSIAHELPFMGVKVINASLNNPHYGFTFSYTPTNLVEYQKIIHNLNLLSFEPDLDSLYDYFFVRFIRFGGSWFIPNSRSFFQSIGGVVDSNWDLTLTCYLESSFKVSRDCSRNAILNFLASRDLVFTPKHYLNSHCGEESRCACQSLKYPRVLH